MNGNGKGPQGRGAFEKVVIPDGCENQVEERQWNLLLHSLITTVVRVFRRIPLDKWGVCISLILEALDAKCENKTAFRAVIAGVRDDIDHRLQYGRW